MRFASAILILLVPCLAVAKTRHCGSIRGIVLDEYGNAVANAHVFANANRSGAGFLTAADKKTDDDGSFEFEQLPMGVQGLGRQTGSRLSFYSPGLLHGTPASGC
jgi:hypothetical protein